MRKLVIMASIIVLGGCRPPNNYSNNTSGGSRIPDIPESTEIVWKSVNRDHGNIAIVHDTVTGCEYIELDDKTMYPRLNSSGQPMCGQQP